MSKKTMIVYLLGLLCSLCIGYLSRIINEVTSEIDYENVIIPYVSHVNIIISTELYESISPGNYFIDEKFIAWKYIPGKSWLQLTVEK